MAVHLITGFKSEEHIQSADQGSFNASFFGEGEFVMEAGNQCEASILDNNTVRILDGDILMQGRHIRIPSNTYIDVAIQTGTAGVNRNDMIVMEYSKDAGTGVETADLKVIHGVAAEGTASDPAYTSGDILAGGSLNQMPLYRVKVEGVVLSAVEPMFTTIPTYRKLAEQYAKQFEEACSTYLGALNILDTKEEIEANTKENQLAGALALKEVIAFTKENTTMYYDAETDKKYLKNQAGKWVEVGYGGLLYKYLYSNGNQYSDITGGWTGTGTYNVNSDGKLYVAATNGQSTLYTKNANMDLTGHRYLEIVYSANISHALSSNYARIKLMNGNSEIATKSFDSATTENNTWRIDLSSNQEAVSACQIKVEIAESGTSEIYISEVRLITS